MKRAGFLLALFVVLTLSVSAMAQGDNSVYFVTYYSNNVSGAPDGTLRIINDGDEGQTIETGIYVFDDSQEMQACGYCYITPDGLLSEDVKTQLTNNTLTGKTPSRGVIKVISYTEGPHPGLRGWATHIQRATPTSGTYTTTEAQLADSNLTTAEQENLVDLCYYILYELGSGQGQITCTPEDHDF